MRATQKAAKSQSQLKLNVLAGAISTATSVGVFNPLDTIRIRWQVRTGASAQAEKSLLVFAQNIVQKEGFVNGLYRPAIGVNMASVALSSGIRLGFYPWLRDSLVAARQTSFLSGDGNKSVIEMWLAGFISGAVGFFLATPFFQAKTRFQAQGQLRRTNYKSGFGCLVEIARKEGFVQSYRGASVLMVRGALLSAGAQTGYDRGEQFWSNSVHLEEGPVLHVLASIGSAFLASTCSAPADVLMTRHQAAPMFVAQGEAPPTLLQTATSMVRSEGPQVFFRGWLPFFARLCPLFTLNYVLYERVRVCLGLGFLD